MEPKSSSKEVLICQTCGDEGFTNAFIYCVRCLGFVIHRYCLDVMPRTFDEFVPWLCDDCKLALPNQVTLPKVKSSRSQKVDAARKRRVKATRRKKKLKKQRSVTVLVTGKANVKCKGTRGSDLKFLGQTDSPPKDSLTKSNSRHEQITPCAITGTEEGICQKQVSETSQPGGNCSPIQKGSKRKRKATCSAKRKQRKHRKSLKHGTREVCVEMLDSVDRSLSDSISSPMRETSKNKQAMATSVEEQRCESQSSQLPCEMDKRPDLTGSEKLVSDSSSMKKESNTKTKDYDYLAKAASQMPREQDMNVSKADNDVSQSMGFANNEFENHYLSARPVIDPVWRGNFNILHTDYDLLEGFVAHLSSKACYKVCEEASTLPSLLSLEMHPKTVLWPKSFVQAEPSDENIALYFFPGETKNERAFDHLVMDMMDEGLAMKAVAKNAELLIFTSTVLPRAFWRFQGKYYLWGVFRGKRKSPSTPANNDLPVSNNSNVSGLSEHSPNEVTSRNKTLTRVKTLDAQSPQSPLCSIGVRGVDPESGD